MYESAAGAPTQSSFDEKEIGGGRVHRVVIEVIIIIIILLLLF